MTVSMSLTTRGKTAGMALQSLVAVAKTAVDFTSGADEQSAYFQLGAAGAEAGFFASALYASRRHSAAAEEAEKESWSNVYASLRLLFNAIAVIQVLEILNGFGSLDTGENFNDYSEKFVNDIQNIFCGANPTQWDGPGSYEYDHQNHEQQCRVRVMARADSMAAQTINAQAQLVGEVRELFIDCKLGFVGGVAVLTAGLTLWQSYRATGNFDLADAIAKSMAGFTWSLIVPAVLFLVAVIVELMYFATNFQKYLDDNVTFLYQVLVDDVHECIPVLKEPG